MRRYLLSTILCLTGYLGAYASNEVTESMVISEEIEMSKFEDLNSSELMFSDYNCWAEFKVISPLGQEQTLGFGSFASSQEDCNNQIASERGIYEEAGYTIVEDPWTHYNPG